MDELQESKELLCAYLENGGFHFSGKECALHKCEFNSPDIQLKKGKQDGNTMLGVIIIIGILTHGFHRLLSKMKHSIDIHEYCIRKDDMQIHIGKKYTSRIRTCTK